MTAAEFIEAREELDRLKAEGKYVNLQEDLMNEYGWCFKKEGDDSFGDVVIDMAQEEYENELNLLDKKMEDYAENKIKKLHGSTRVMYVD